MKRLVALTAAIGLGVLGLAAAPAAQAAPDPHIPPVTWGVCPAGVQAYAAIFQVTTIQCGRVDVPEDYAHPQGKKITLEVSRVPHTGPGKAKGVVLVNPGGPGGSGTGFAARVFGQGSAAIQAVYDFIGFDPRGVGDSTPSLNCDTNYFKPVRADYVPSSKAEINAWLLKSKGYAAACATKYGSLLDHMKSTDWARDMDSIRKSLGERKINYYGASYGTYLGAVYATMFPHRVNRMVLDSNVRPSGVWYDDNIDQDYAFDRNLNIFFGWVAKYDSIYHVGTTEAAVRSFYYASRTALKAVPAGGLVGPSELDDTYQYGGYRASSAVWSLLAKGLAGYKAGQTQPLVDAFNAVGATPDDNTFAVYNAVQCTDIQWPMDWAKWNLDTRHVYKTAPFLAWGNAWFNAPCLYWAGKAGTPVHIGDIRHLPGILLFQATLDAATPFNGGVEMHSLLKGSHLVVEDGGKTHGVVHRGNLPLDAYYDAYLLDGTMPAQDTVHVPALPDPVPAASAARVAGSVADLGILR
ncbi:MAG: hypothetical protein JWN00_2848 [Actinomycetia bacterium]|nr:hypothetical protein [Actinomycetes bacterium]